MFPLACLSPAVQGLYQGLLPLSGRCVHHDLIRDRRPVNQEHHVTEHIGRMNSPIYPASVGEDIGNQMVPNMDAPVL